MFMPWAVSMALKVVQGRTLPLYALPGDLCFLYCLKISLYKYIYIYIFMSQYVYILIPRPVFSRWA